MLDDVWSTGAHGPTHSAANIAPDPTTVEATELTAVSAADDATDFTSYEPVFPAHLAAL